MSHLVVGVFAVYAARRHLAVPPPAHELRPDGRDRRRRRAAHRGLDAPAASRPSGTRPTWGTSRSRSTRADLFPYDPAYVAWMVPLIVVAIVHGRDQAAPQHARARGDRDPRRARVPLLGRASPTAPSGTCGSCRSGTWACCSSRWSARPRSSRGVALVLARAAPVDWYRPEASRRAPGATVAEPLPVDGAADRPRSRRRHRFRRSPAELDRAHPMVRTLIVCVARGRHRRVRAVACRTRRGASCRTGCGGTTAATRTSTAPSPGSRRRSPSTSGLMETLEALPPGRSLWEPTTASAATARRSRSMLLPYWTDGRIPSMEGLYYESSATTPYHFMAVATLAGPATPQPGARAAVQDDRRLRPRRALPPGCWACGTTSRESERGQAGGRRQPRPRPGRDRSPDLDGASAARLDDLRGARLAAGRGAPVTSRSSSTGVPARDWQDDVAVPWWDAPGTTPVDARRLDILGRPLVADGPEAWKRARPPGVAQADAPDSSLPANNRLPLEAAPAVEVSRHPHDRRLDRRSTCRGPASR